MKFLKDRLLNENNRGFPFRAKSIQTYGGSEFTKYFEDICREYGMPLYILPPSKPI
ncbi:MAG: hypothetical protein LBI29_01645 [Rickettsiales bacterium]|jgi:hypothetical protein|nr:hypothetical protein [Rickettsiales bacterium]